MKIINPSAFNIVKSGIEFHIAASSSKEGTTVAQLLPNMERNEGAVYWLQPKNGTVEQQEACMCVNGVFYALNSKFEKAIFRNVRLTRDFQNMERLADGTRNLVIPKRLFCEKLRTSRRVSTCSLFVNYFISYWFCLYVNVLINLCVFPQNLPRMKKIQDINAKYTETQVPSTTFT
jgi:hypothetical protein